MDWLIEEFYEKMENVNLNALGIIDSNDKIHTLGTDSKLIGRIFEMHAQPVLEEIAEEHGIILKTPDSQTTYPDFILMANENDNAKIAIDVKTTYVVLTDQKLNLLWAHTAHICVIILRILNINIRIMQSTM